MQDVVFSQRLAVISEIASVVAFGLSIVALVMAKYQIYLSRQQTREAQQLTTSMAQDLGSRLSTQFCGDFPAYLSKVAKLIREAEFSLKVMAIVPSHGSYSDEDGWRNIKQAIEAKLGQNLHALNHRNFTAGLIYSSSARFQESFRIHHSALANDPTEWQRWRRAEIANGHLPRFMRNRPEFANLESLELDDYLHARLAEDRKIINEVYCDFSQMECDETLPMFLWIADNHTALFSIRVEDKRGHYNGAGIVTSEPGLVGMLVKTFDYYAGHPKTKLVKGAVATTA
jgi:hypothetical protein